MIFQAIEDSFWFPQGLHPRKSDRARDAPSFTRGNNIC